MTGKKKRPGVAAPGRGTNRNKVTPQYSSSLHKCNTLNRRFQDISLAEAVSREREYINRTRNYGNIDYVSEFTKRIREERIRLGID